MKRVIFLNRFFFPDHSATSQILSDLAFHLAASGTETHVITSRQLYDEPHARLLREETVRDVHIHISIAFPQATSDDRRCGDAASTIYPTILRLHEERRT